MPEDTILATALAVILIALAAAFSWGQHLGKKAALDELMRKPVSMEPFKKSARANA